MALVRYIDDPSVEGWAGKWNPAGIGEVVIFFRDGSASSEYASKLEPVNKTREEWYEELARSEP